MSEQKTLTCPNCGAAITNHRNCEFCGSLLVRFVDKGIDLSKTTYLNDNATFKGLAEALQRNLELQNSTMENVVTDIYDKYNNYKLCVMRSASSKWLDGTMLQLSDSQNGLTVVKCFSDSNYRDKEREARLRKLDSFHLFTVHSSIRDGWRCREYAIDFGSDADGAARLISELLTKVYLYPANYTLSCHTNVGDFNVESDRKAMGNTGNVVEPVKPKTDEDDFYWDLVWKITGAAVGLAIWWFFF